MARAAGTTKRILAISSRRRPPLRGAGAGGRVEVAAWADAAVRTLESDMGLLLSSAERGSARAGLGHRFFRSRLTGEDQLHAGVDRLGRLRPLGAELSGAGASRAHRVDEAGDLRDVG